MLIAKYDGDDDGEVIEAVADTAADVDGDNTEADSEDDDSSTESSSDVSETRRTVNTGNDRVVLGQWQGKEVESDV